MKTAITMKIRPLLPLNSVIVAVFTASFPSMAPQDTPSPSSYTRLAISTIRPNRDGVLNAVDMQRTQYQNAKDS
jgi:hypothetical protein